MFIPLPRFGVRWGSAYLATPGSLVWSGGTKDVMIIVDR